MCKSFPRDPQKINNLYFISTLEHGQMSPVEEDMVENTQTQHHKDVHFH